MNNCNKSIKLFGGVIPPIITPLTQKLELDVEGLDKLLEFLISDGVNGIFVGGTSGEADYVSEKVYMELCKHCIQKVNGRVPVLLGAIEPSTVRTIERIRVLEEIGGEIFVATPAFYLQNSCQDEVVRHYEHIASATTGQLVAYNIPGTTHVNILPETIARLDAFDNIVLYKDSCADFEQIQRNIYALRDTHISLFNGAEELCAVSMAFGAQGCVPGLANFFPKLFIDCCRYAQAGQIAQASALQEKIYRVRKAIFAGKHWMASMKYLAHHYGFGEGGLSLPVEPLTAEQMHKIDTIIEKEGL